MKRNAYMRIVILLLVFALTIPLFSCVGEVPEDESTHESQTNDSTEGENEQTGQNSENSGSSDNTEDSGSQGDSNDTENNSSLETSDEDSVDGSDDDVKTEDDNLDSDNTEVGSDETENTESEGNDTDSEETYEEESDTVAPCTHQYDYDCSKQCALCDEPRTDYEDHSWLFVSGTADLLSGGSMVLKCTACEKKETQSTEQPLAPELLGMPVIYIEDYVTDAIPLANLKKSDGEIAVKYKYVSNNADIEDFEAYCKIKIQGASSAVYIKKNFTVKFYKDAEFESKKKVDLGWGKENKYCMKANYVDFSQSRNIVAARIFARVVQTRDNIPEGLKNAPNYGLIDGYPVLVYLNNEFHGLYTMNIPKDSWQFAMEGEEEAREALLMADDHSDSVSLRAEIGEFSDEPGAEKSWEDYGWEVEHCSTSDESWIRDSFNALIRLLNCGDGARIRAELPSHLDIEAAIDNMIFPFFINGADNRTHNTLWATYDGQVWIPSMYDMDGTFGLFWNGQPTGTTIADGAPLDSYNIYPYYRGNVANGIAGINKMWEVLLKYYPDEVEARYEELRRTALNKETTSAMFNAFCSQIHSTAYNSEYKKWKTDDNNYTVPYDYARVTKTNMVSSTVEQLERLDAFFFHIQK